MLGNLNAPPPVHSFGLSTLIGLTVAKNLLVDKRRLNTCLNGKNSSLLLGLPYYEQRLSCFFFDKRDYYKLNCQNPIDPFNFCLSKTPLARGGRKANNEKLKNNASTKNSVPNRIAPRQLPGVYMILCGANNKRYYGESNNVSARLSQHKSRLRRNIHDILELQHDWNIYGETFFDFVPLFLFKTFDKSQREILELEHIARHYNLCYNKFAKGSRKKQNNPFWGHKHSEMTKKQISKSLIENYKNSIPEGLPIILKGEIYPSISEASRQTNHSRDTIRRWLNDPYNRSCEPIDTSQRHIKMAQGEQCNTGFPKLISLNGIQYSSIAEAARKLNCSRANIQRRLKTDKDNCFFL